MNTSLGKWTEYETNWSKDDDTFIKKALEEKLIPTSYEELLNEHEAKLINTKINK